MKYKFTIELEYPDVDIDKDDGIDYGYLNTTIQEIGIDLTRAIEENLCPEKLSVQEAY